MTVGTTTPTTMAVVLSSSLVDPEFSAVNVLDSILKPAMVLPYPYAEDKAAETAA
jgi:hypothetical protein